jgi:hypothetical protein
MPPTMNLGPLQSRALSPAIQTVAAGQVAPVAGSLHAISGNSLLGVDVWAGVGASGRSFHVSGGLSASGSGDIEQTVGHILAPLS